MSSGIDTLGTVTAMFTTNSTSASITYPSPTNPATFVGATINYTNYMVQTGFSCFGLQEYGPKTMQLVSSIVMPDGSRYSFTYEATPQAPANTTGRLASITLPSGVIIRYQYTSGSYGTICADASNSGLTRTTPDGIWTYTRQVTQTALYNGQPGVVTSSITTVTDPLGNVNKVNFGTSDRYESKRQVFSGSTTLLATIETCYNGAAFPCTGTSGGEPILRRTVQRELPDTTGKIAKTDTYLSLLGLVTDVYDYDFGTGSVGPLLRHTATAYATLSANIFYDPNNPSTSYPVTIYDRPTTVTVTDGSTTQARPHISTTKPRQRPRPAYLSMFPSQVHGETSRRSSGSSRARPLFKRQRHTSTQER